MSYHQLDLIADAYIPLLILITIIGLIHDFIHQGFKMVGRHLFLLFSGVLFIYGLMFLDLQLNIWTSLSLDYSTHNALALVFVTAISFRARGKKKIAVVVSMLIYISLMIYQEYHTFLDILSTTVVVGPVLVWLNYKYKYQAHD